MASRWDVEGEARHRPFVLFAGTANPDLAAAVATDLGTSLGRSQAGRFPDGELQVQLDEPVRGREVFIVQPTAPPVNDHLVELLAFADACRRSGAARITAVVPYFGYSRSDKRHGRREPIMASLVATLLQAAGIAQVITLDLHAAQIEGFFQIPVTGITAVPVLHQALAPSLPADTVVVSPDAGRVRMATMYAELLNTSLVVLHKERFSGAETAVTRVVGEVRGRACLIVDDMISTGGTILKSVEALLVEGAQPRMVVAATHALLVGDAVEKLSHPAITAVYVSDSVAVGVKGWATLKVVSVASLLADAIRRYLSDASLADLC